MTTITTTRRLYLDGPLRYINSRQSILGNPNEQTTIKNKNIMCAVDK